jgi:hypothetical protein
VVTRGGNDLISVGQWGLGNYGRRKSKEPEYQVALAQGQPCLHDSFVVVLVPVVLGAMRCSSDAAVSSAGKGNGNARDSTVAVHATVESSEENLVLTVMRAYSSRHLSRTNGYLKECGIDIGRVRQGELRGLMPPEVDQRLSQARSWDTSREGNLFKLRRATRNSSDGWS